MTTYAFLLDLGRCLGCQACVAACKAGNELPPGVQYIDISEQTRGTFPNLQSFNQNQRCYHCLDAACVAVCPSGALFKQAGLTRLDISRCSGCAYCVDACPFSVPKQVAGHASKCDGCAAVVKAGGQPWCVRTCPSNALRYGQRQEILTEAHRRIAALAARYPRARIYGETEAGGLGLVIVLPDDPEIFALPADPQIPLTLKIWQDVVQPTSLGLIGLGAIVSGLAALIARRNRNKELARVKARSQGTNAAATVTAEKKEA